MRKTLTLTLLFFLSILAIQSVKGQSCNGFYDGFESGTYSPTWVPGSGSFTYSVTNSNSAVGTYNFSVAGGGSSHLTGIHANFPTNQPNYISVRVKSNSVSHHDGYFAVGTSATNTGSQLLYFYFAASAKIRFLGGTTYEYTYVANQWYHIEYKNINWSTRTFDIWVNGQLVDPGHAFYSSSISNVNTVNLYNFSSGSQCYYDEIIIGSAPMSVALSPQNPTCANSSNGTIGSSLSGGTPGFSYLWSTGDTIDSLSGLPAGTYTLLVTDNNGCTDLDTVTLTSPPAITTTLGGQDPLCNGGTDGTGTIAASGGTPGFSYLWSNSDTSGSISGLAAGTYTVTVTDNAGCTETDTLTLSEPTAVTASLATGPISCNGSGDGSLTVNAGGGTPGYTYLWNTAATTGMINNLGPGTYTVAVTDSNGCTVSDSATLSEPTQVTLSLSATDISCNGAGDGSIMVTANGGTPGYSYTWNTNDTTGTVSNLGPGTYSVSVTDANGCPAGDSATLSQPAAITATVTVSDESAPGAGDGAIDLTPGGGIPPYTFSWSNGATSEDLSNIGAGTYIVTIADSNGCTLMDTFIVSAIVGISALENAGIKLFPNPVNDRIFLELEGSFKGDATVEIFDMRGQTVAATSPWDMSQTTQLRLYVQQLARGMYILRVSSASGNVHFRFRKD